MKLSSGHSVALSLCVLLGTLFAVNGHLAAADSKSKKDAAPPKVGETAKDFLLKALGGKAVKLTELTEKGNVVLVVLRGYPGYQCPICTKQVGRFIQRAQDFADAGVQVVFVYPGPNEKLEQRAAEFVKNKALPDNFHFLLDPDYAFTTSYGLRWDAPRETAYPSTFIIDSDRKVLFATVSKKHGGRVSAKKVLRALDHD
jgi:peroxiredoxin